MIKKFKKISAFAIAFCLCIGSFAITSAYAETKTNEKLLEW